MKLRTIVLLLIILVFPGGVVGCGKKGPPAPPPNTIDVLENLKNTLESANRFRLK